MARDRKRAKQRRARQAGAGSPFPSLEDSGTPTVEVQGEGDGPFPEELVAVGATDAGEDSAAVAAGKPSGGAPRSKPSGNRVIGFLGACWEELRRVQWPDRRQVAQATGVVLGFVVVAGSFLGLMDALWQRVVDLII